MVMVKVKVRVRVMVKVMLKVMVRVMVLGVRPTVQLGQETWNLMIFSLSK